MGLFAYLVLVCLKIGRIQSEENKSKKLYVIFYVERISSCSPKLINKCLTSAENVWDNHQHMGNVTARLSLF